MTSTTFREKLTSYAILGPFAILLAFPFYWMLWTSFKTDQDLYNVEKVPFGFAEGSPTLHNYRFLLEETQYLTWVKNTLFVGVVVVLITLVLAVPAGYALARLSGRWGQSLGVGIFLTYLVPPTLLFLPLNRVIAELGLQDKLWSLILIYPSFTVPFSTWLLMGFFKTIPRELEDAALVDGCTQLGAFVRVVLPNAAPGLVATAVYAFLFAWDELLFVASLTQSTAETIPIGIRNFIGAYQERTAQLMAAGVVSTLPVLIAFFATQRWLVKGLTAGAVKG